MDSLRSRTNAKAATKSGLGGLLGYWYFYLSYIVNWDIGQIIAPENLEILVVNSVTVFLGVGTVGGWNRDKPNSNQTVIAPEKPSNGFKSEGGTTSVKPPRKNWFSQSELECKGQSNCSHEYAGMSPTTLAMANDVRDRFGRTFCNSGHRCKKHNDEIPTATKGSYHIPANDPTGPARAMDLRPSEVSPKEVYEYLIAKYPNQYGFGLYDRFVHIDDRTDSWARKDGPSKEWKSFENISINL